MESERLNLRNRKLLFKSWILCFVVCSNLCSGLSPLRVSINTPVRVRLFSNSALSISFVSIHAPVRVRRSFYLNSIKEKLFQFTHPWGCDLTNVINGYLRYSFNSRTREGATFFFSWPFLKMCFNSRTREGATTLYPNDRKPWMFQFTHPWECPLCQYSCRLVRWQNEIYNKF